MPMPTMLKLGHCPVSVSVTGRSSVETAEGIELGFGVRASFDLCVRNLGESYMEAPELWTSNFAMQVDYAVSKTRRW